MRYDYAALLLFAGVLIGFWLGYRTAMIDQQECEDEGDYLDL